MCPSKRYIQLLMAAEHIKHYTYTTSLCLYLSVANGNRTHQDYAAYITPGGVGGVARVLLIDKQKICAAGKQ